MIRRSRGAAAAAATWLAVLGSPLCAQTVGTLDIGASFVEYEGFLVSGAGVVSPAFRYDAARLSVGAQGTWVLFESGSQIFQANAAAAWLTPAISGVRAEFAGSFGVGRYEDAPSYGHMLARTRVHVHDDDRGTWAGAAKGQAFGDSTETPTELAMGVWAVWPGLAVAGTATGTWLSNDRYVDLVGSARWSISEIEIDVQTGVRPQTRRARAKVYGQLSVRFPLTKRLDLSLGGGRYPPDPARGVIGATYGSLGVRFNMFKAPLPTPYTITRAMVRAERALEASVEASRASLEIAGTRNNRLLRVHVRGASSVELMGDFTDWQPVALTRTSATTWEIQLPVDRGVHRVNVRVDDSPWLVPRGTRLEETEFGGAAGVVVVP